MAHPSKFVSVNLNKSYGRPSPNPSSNPRARHGPHSSSSSAGGGGMVVLSRPRSSSSSSSAPKLSVPPPLNLPSLRKENEKLDLSSAAGSSARPGSSGIGSGSGSSSIGWMKPAPPPPPRSGGGGSYVPPAVRDAGQVVGPTSPGPVVEKAVFLRGEDFPSLKATFKKEKIKEDEKEKEKVELNSPLRMRPQMRSSRVTNNVSDFDSNRSLEEEKKKEHEEKYFPGPLPLVRLTHTSDWADDERDTGLSLPKRDRDRGSSRFELNHRGLDRDSEIGKEFNKGDSFGLNKDGRDVASSWRMSLSKPLGVTREVNKDSTFSHSPYGGNARDGLSNGRRDLGYGNNNMQNGKNVVGQYGGDVSNNRYTFQNNSAPLKTPFSYGTKGLSLNDPILNFNREKRGMSSPNSGKSYLGDTSFDATDPFTDDPIEDLNMKVFKKKKEIQKQAEFHDPVRESFEAELERVQRIQEQERQRAMEEQERAMEIVRREQEERERLAREEEERRRLIEEQAREAAWRVEQEKMEAARRVEEQKIAREEEKRRLLLEEERRKEAARQKLMELEAKIARRQSESNQKDDKIPSDVGDWEDGERMVEHITSTSSDSSTNRYFDTSSSRFAPVRDASSSSMERGKYVNYWKKDAYDNGQSSIFNAQVQESEYHSLRPDAFGSNRGFAKRESYEPSSNSSMPDDMRYMRGNRWNVGGGDSDHFTRNLDVDGGDFLDNDKFGDGGWGGYGRLRGSPNNPYSERPFQNSEVDGGFPPYARSRHSLRQPRVLPPPSISSMRQGQSSLRSATDESRYQNDDGYHLRVQQPRTPELLESDAISLEQKEEKDSPRCDSQSSLSVSNPPSSPTQLSHDDLDEAEDSRALQTSQTSVEEHLGSGIEEAENTNTLEDDEWAIENNEEIQEQEEYDDEDDGYQEEEEVAHDRDNGGNLDMGQELDDPTSDVLPNATTGEMGQLVLGFDEGAEVSIPTDDDLEKTSQNFEKSIEDQNDSQVDNTVTEEAKSEPSIMESEMALQKLVLDPVPSSASNPSDSSQENKVQEMPVPSTSIAQPTSSAVSTVDGQSEPPMRLQFGLFSGPPLIPSPVPAIQIGSIQMPLHLHPQVGTSITQMHPPQPPYFQFGQLRYPTLISQGILPLTPQTVSFVHPPQNLGISRHNQARHESSFSQNNPIDKVPSGPGEGQAGLLKNPLDLSQENSTNQPRSDVIHDITSRRNYKPMISNRESQVQSGRAPGIISTSRGKRYTYTVRNAGTRSSFSMPENTRPDSSGFQRRPRRSVRRTEFRVRENVDKRQGEGMESNAPHCSGRSGISGRYGAKKDAALNKSTENLKSSATSSQLANSDGKIVNKAAGKEVEVSSKKRVSSLENARTGGENGKRHVSTMEDVDVPLQSGVVRVFKQAGIEAPSDEDDFIEVRSKKQMLNDRREQREKEIKAKSKVIKAPRKHRAVPLSNAVTFNSKKALASSGANVRNSVRPDPVITGGRGFASVDASPVFAANVTSQTLPPIGIPPGKVNTDTRSSNSLKSSQAVTIPVTTSAAAKFVPSLSFDSKSSGFLNASLPLDSWSNPDINQQVMALTQSQLDDAMKPVRFDSQVVSTISLEPSKPSTSIMPQEKTFSPSASPLNSLLAGERIQFGAVTSPTILPPVIRVVSNGIGPPGSSRSDNSKENNDHSMFFDKEKHSDEPCAHLEDPEAEAEAEAAASAVAVAAISNNDEIVGNRINVCSISDSKSFSGADNTELITSGGVAVSQEVTGQFVAEESLTVSLPADLSVDTPLPLWHPSPSPQSTSGPNLSHFPGGPHSHFPMGFDMNPIFGGPIFAFSQHDESGGTQPQLQRSNTLGSGPPLGAWPQCHSRVDSFYGPPAGFTGPFISPPGGIPGVQAPPHMVVYNHFAPVGQFGQVGLSFMGTTYIPTGKQPDWKHNPVPTSTVGVSEGEIVNANGVSGQRNSPSMPSPIQHLAPGSPLMPMPSPLAMFDMSPLQSSADIPYQARWSHVPAPPIHSVPLTMPPQHQHQHQHQYQHQQQQQQQPSQQVDGGIPQFTCGLPVDPTTANDRFSDPRSSDNNQNSSVPKDSSRQFPDELHMMDSTSTNNTVQTIRPSYMPSRSSNTKGSHSSKHSSRNALGIVNQETASSGPQQYLHTTSYGDQRGAAAASSHKGSSGGEWHRRINYQGRGQALGSDKDFAPSKMKQIYVAKPPASRPATSG